MKIYTALLPLLAATVSCEVLPETTGPEPAPTGAGCAFEITSDCPVASVDILVYADEGLRPLERHIHLDTGPGGTGVWTDSLVLGKGGKMAVAFGNLPWRLNIDALGNYANAEQMSVRFEDDDPEFPACSGTATFAAGEDFRLSLRPLMCRVVVSEVSNHLEGYTRVEDPRVYLRNMNASAELLRGDGFRPSELIGRSAVLPLPCDIGLFAQYPEAVLYCYPDDSGTDILGTPARELVFECEIRGETREFREPLPPSGRGSTLRYSVRIGENGAEFYLCPYN